MCLDNASWCDEMYLGTHKYSVRCAHRSSKKICMSGVLIPVSDGMMAYLPYIHVC